MNNKFWEHFAYGYSITNFLCIFILLEIIFFGKPFITLFLIIFYIIYRFNKRLFQKYLNY